MPPASVPTIEDLQRATPRVLARLREMAQFPAHGTVAGQAVASLFWEELGLPMRGPVNDIDVFVNFHLPRDQRGIPEPQTDPGPHSRPTVRSQATVSSYRKIQVKDDGYGQGKFLAMRATTGILRTYTVGLVNFTLISPATHRKGIKHSASQSQELVDEFDLNMVAVGINLDEERAVASPAFLRFLADRQVRAQTANTPAHTLVRLASKLHSGQLSGVWCDYPAQRAMLELAIACQDLIAPRLVARDERKPARITRFGSPKYRALAQKFAHLLPPTHTKANATGYEFTYFDVAPPATENGRLLLSACLPLTASDPSWSTHVAYFSRFPVLYDLFHPQPGDQADQDRRDRQIQAFKQAMASDNAEEVFLKVHEAMGIDLPRIKMQSLTSLEAVDFLYGTDPAHARSLAGKWNTLPVVEAVCLAAANIKAADFQALLDDPDARWPEIFAAHHQVVHESLATASQVSPRNWQATALATRFISWLADPQHAKQNGFAFSQVVRSMFPAASVLEEPFASIMPRVTRRPSHVSGILDFIPARQAAGLALINAPNAKENVRFNHDPEILDALRRIDLSLDMDPATFPTLASHGKLAACLFDACLNFPLDSYPHAREPMLRMLQILDPIDLFNRHGHLLRALATAENGAGLLHEIAPRVLAHPEAGQALAGAVDFLEMEIARLDDPLWLAHPPDQAAAHRAHALLQSWMLSLGTGPAAPRSAGLRF